METRVNISFRNTTTVKDSEKRAQHIFERMKLRGIGLDQIKEAIAKGAKRVNTDKTIVANYRWFRVIYREFRLENTRKIYPITVIEV